MSEITPEAGGEQRIVRAYGWGLLTVWDSAAQVAPERSDDALVWATDDALSIPVRHAQDVDGVLGMTDDPGTDDGTDAPDDGTEDTGDVVEFPVTVTIRVSAPDARLSRQELEPDYVGMLSCPSGILSVGDADELAEIPIGVGRWHVTVAVDPKDYPERVEVWLAPGLAPAAASPR